MSVGPSVCCLCEVRTTSGPGPFIVIGTEARHFQNLLCLMLNLFRTFLLVWLLGLPVAILFLECYANVVFRGHEGGREPCLGWAPGW